MVIATNGSGGPIRTPQRPVRRSVAVLVSRFPLVTETFILRELVELERQGQPVLLVPLMRERAAIVHPEAVAWVRRAHYAPFFSVAVLAANLRAWRRRPLRLPLLLGRLLVGSVRSPRTLLKTLALFPRAVYIAERLEAEGIRHVHAHFATHPTTAALIVHELTGISFSITAHAHDIFVDRALLGWKLERAAFVRVISRYNAAYLKRLYPAQTAGKLRVIHVGVDWRAYGRPPGAAAEPQHAGAETAVPLILCIAALKPYKGLSILIEACRVLRGDGIAFDCEIIGEGPLRGTLARAISSTGLTDTVRLLGARPQDEVRRRLVGATLVVLPSVVARDGQMEGIPVALMEAMASGVPVIASALSGIPELVVPGRTGELVPPGDAVALAGAIRRLLADPARMHRHVVAARRRVRRKFSLTSTVAALVRQLERANPPLLDEVSELVSVLGRESERGAVGVRRVHERRDSRVVELLLPRDGEIRATVLKVQRPRRGESRSARERGRHEYAVLKALWADRDTACAVPEPLELDKRSGAVLMEPCRGEPLDRLIRAARGSRDPRRVAALLEAIRATGFWLNGFQARTQQELDPRPALDALVDRGCAHLAALERAEFLTEAHAAATATRLGELAAAAAARARLVRHHGDFWPGNVFISEDGVQVIDFEGFRLGLPEEDPAWFLVHLELSFAYPVLQSRGRRAAAAFLDGLPADSASLELSRTTTALTLLSRSVEEGHTGPRATLRRRALRSVVRRAVRATAE
jgi:glycosyltransferase involved in cell wall biosynthesis/aminoglycoside phosphotransferase (APT) family kinase protein